MSVVCQREIVMSMGNEGLVKTAKLSHVEEAKDTVAEA
jgi:hypothetical protein